MEKKSHKLTSRGEKTICLPITDKKEYQSIIDDARKFRAYLEESIPEYPEIFPSEIYQGFSLFGCCQSKKRNLKIRRIQLKANVQIYQLRPGFLMPYMLGKTKDFEKPLYLRRYGVPFDALTYVFGKNDMYWYRAFVALGRSSLVGTTIKQETMMPQHLLADEKHSQWKGQKVYLPTVAANGCLLGIDIVENSDSDSLIKGYSTFANEAKNLDPNDSPGSVNLDGWPATPNAWKTIFPQISIILCFLHLVLGIKDYLRRDQSILKTIQEKLWSIYHGESKRQFSQRLRRFWEWSKAQTLPEKVHQKINKARANSHQFQFGYNDPDCDRTSNQIDRLMNYQERILYQMQYFHGSMDSARLFLRAIALIGNFHPLCGRISRQSTSEQGNYPVEKFNHCCYSHNWLENLLISGSMNGYRTVT